jgi:hypothetical protein
MYVLKLEEVKSSGHKVNVPHIRERGKGIHNERGVNIRREVCETTVGG